MLRYLRQKLRIHNGKNAKLRTTVLHQQQCNRDHPLDRSHSTDADASSLFYLLFFALPVLPRIARRGLVTSVTRQFCQSEILSKNTIRSNAADNLADFITTLLFFNTLHYISIAEMIILWKQATIIISSDLGPALGHAILATYKWSYCKQLTLAYVQYAINTFSQVYVHHFYDVKIILIERKNSLK